MGIPVNPYDSVWEFERQVAAFAGSKHGIAVDSCTSAIFLCCKAVFVTGVTIPAKTYISVPSAVVHAGGRVSFVDETWSGSYRLKPYQIWDSALRFRRGMFQETGGGMQCLSFQTKKLLPIGRGGMILTDDDAIAKWLRMARSNGRNTDVPFADDSISMLGWNMAMTPEQGSRGLDLLAAIADNLPDQQQEYPDLRKMPVFQSAERQAA